MRQGVDRLADLARTNGVLQAQQEASPDAILVVDEARPRDRGQPAVRRDCSTCPPEPLVTGANDRTWSSAAPWRRFADPAARGGPDRGPVRPPRRAVATDLVSLADGRLLERYTRPAVGAGRPGCWGRVWFFRDVTDRQAAEALGRRRSTASSPWSPAGPTTPSSSPTPRPHRVGQPGLHAGDRVHAGRGGRPQAGRVPPGPRDRPGHGRARPGRRPAGARGVRTEIKNYGKDGRPYWLAMDIQPVRDPAGRITNFVAIESDVTDRRAAEAEVEPRGVALLRSLIDSIPDLIFYKDADAVYLGCNRAFAEYVGRTPAEVVGLRDDDLFDADVAAGRRAAVRELLATKPGPSSSRRRSLLPRPAGSSPPTPCGRPWVGPGGEFLGVIGVSRDITDRKAAEHEVKVAHELAELARGGRRAGRARPPWPPASGPSRPTAPRASSWPT